MVHQHRELHLQLDNTEKLWRYAQSTASKHHALEDTLDKTKAKFKHWEQKAKEGIERMTGAEKKRKEAKEEAQIAWLIAVAVGDAKTRAEDELVRV